MMKNLVQNNLVQIYSHHVTAFLKNMLNDT